MSLIPVTSTTLLKDISGDANSARWSEFVARYRPMMESYLRERFPFLEHDDVIQETLLTLVAKLPSYRYVPNETGYFHNYLTGILRRKALRVCERNKRRGEVMAEYRQEPQVVAEDDEREIRTVDGFSAAIRYRHVPQLIFAFLIPLTFAVFVLAFGQNRVRSGHETNAASIKIPELPIATTAKTIMVTMPRKPVVGTNSVVRTIVSSASTNAPIRRKSMFICGSTEEDPYF